MYLYFILYIVLNLTHIYFNLFIITFDYLLDTVINFFICFITKYLNHSNLKFSFIINVVTVKEAVEEVIKYVQGEYVILD